MKKLPRETHVDFWAEAGRFGGLQDAELAAEHYPKEMRPKRVFTAPTEASLQTARIIMGIEQRLERLAVLFPGPTSELTDDFLKKFKGLENYFGQRWAHSPLGRYGMNAWSQICRLSRGKEPVAVFAPNQILLCAIAYRASRTGYGSPVPRSHDGDAELIKYPVGPSHGIRLIFKCGVPWGHTTIWRG